MAGIVLAEPAAAGTLARLVRAPLRDRGRLAVVSAALFGAMTVLVRIGLRRGPDAAAATLATILPALAVSLVAAAVARRGGRSASRGRSRSPGCSRPGGSQILFTLRDPGGRRVAGIGRRRRRAARRRRDRACSRCASRSSAPLLVGAVLVVAGGAALVAEPGRPQHLRASGLALAAGATVALRVARQPRPCARDADAASPRRSPPPRRCSAARSSRRSTRGGCPSLRTQRAFLPAGICFGLSYLALFEAYYRGRVTVVSPLVATETLWGVGLSALLLRQSELVGRRLLVGAALIVAGGVLIGVFR